MPLREVDVDVPTGRVTVRGGSVDDGTVRAAIVEAGYEVAGACRQWLPDGRNVTHATNWRGNSRSAPPDS
ncbi:heavy-metal-associated domain-containing protein [Streptomyces sp. P17]|uniref:heavy-metal-associated domain-containing protein n=1 Tax=Streptomyces sp. P17 TaxID=3074716 RepID=UPI0028F3FC53|nr:heavy-metal-associated domain-containing protein [Streptomyces sp. P17]MDT9698095.1 heavy-metal-associated domain-containing protein [Streptomyces sp. P17]